MEDATHLPDNAFAVTGTSDDITHSDLERNQSNRLNMSTKELVDSGSIAIDFCCYFDPLDNKQQICFFRRYPIIYARTFL